MYTQRVQINNVLSDITTIICGVSQGSVLGPWKSCLYLLSLSAILMYHKIGYHVYADDPQLYIYHSNLNSHRKQFGN